MAIMRFRCLGSFKIRVSHIRHIPWITMIPYFPHPRQDSVKDILEKKKADSFISSYKFEDKILGIYKKFLDALKLPRSEEKNLIIQDLILQMKRAVSSSPYPMGQDFFKGMTLSNLFTYPSRSDSAPTSWQEISKLM